MLNPYTVTGNTIVNPGVKLTIQPGVVIHFVTGKSLQIQGTLVANGTSESRIRFTSSKASKSRGDWGQIVFKDSAIDASLTGGGGYINGSIIEYCDIEYGGGGVSGTVQLESALPLIKDTSIQNSGSSGINLVSGSLAVQNSIINNNEGTGIFSNEDNDNGPSYNIDIKNSETSYNGHNGIRLYHIGYLVTGTVVIDTHVATGNGQYGGSGHGVSVKATSDSQVTVSNSTLTANMRAGLDVASSGSFTITNNILSNNTRGLYMYNHTAGPQGDIITGNTITNNDSSNENPVWNNYTAGTGGGILINGGGSFTIENNTITGNKARYGGGAYITIDQSTHSKSIKNNVVKSNTATTETGGLYLRLHGSADTSVNLIAENTAPTYSGAHVYLTAGGNSNAFTSNTVAGNTSTSGSGSVLFLSGDGDFSNNNIYGNASTYATYLGSDGAVVNWTGHSLDLAAENNWWGTTDDGSIQGLIYDWFDQASLGILDYTPFLTQANESAPSWSP